MAKKVLKFGGTSVGTIKSSMWQISLKKNRHKIIAVVSAMSGKTNELIKLAKNIEGNFDKRELDVLLSSGASFLRITSWSINKTQT